MIYALTAGTVQWAISLGGFMKHFAPLDYIFAVAGTATLFWRFVEVRNYRREHRAISEKRPPTN
jgi:hypothetical protein